MSEREKLRAQLHTMENSRTGTTTTGAARPYSDHSDLVEKYAQQAEEINVLTRRCAGLLSENKYQHLQISSLNAEKEQGDETLRRSLNDTHVLRQEKAELERELLTARNREKDHRQNLLAAQREKDELVRRLQRLAGPPEPRNPLRQNRDRWVPGCEAYGIGRDEVG